MGPACLLPWCGSCRDHLCANAVKMWGLIDEVWCRAEWLMEGKQWLLLYKWMVGETPPPRNSVSPSLRTCPGGRWGASKVNYWVIFWVTYTITKLSRLFEERRSRMLHALASIGTRSGSKQIHLTRMQLSKQTNSIPRARDKSRNEMLGCGLYKCTSPAALSGLFFSLCLPHFLILVMSSRGKEFTQSTYVRKSLVKHFSRAEALRVQ